VSQQPQIDRRQFSGSLAAGSGLALALVCRLAEATQEKAAVESKEETTPAPEPEAPRRPADEALLLNWLIQRYPSDDYDEVALQGIYRDLRGDLARGRILSQFPLQNSDEPATIFRAYRGPNP
jgi:hypothetical protein